MPRLGQHAVAESKQVAGDARLGVGEERQHPRLGVPEVVAVVGVAGQALGRDPRPFGAPRRLGEVEQVPAHRLLHADRVPHGVLERDVGPIPEAVEAASLRRHERLEPGADHPVESAPAAVDELGGVDAARGLVGGVLEQPDRRRPARHRRPERTPTRRRRRAARRRDGSSRRAHGPRPSRASSRSRPSGSRAPVAPRPAPPAEARGSGGRAAWRCADRSRRRPTPDRRARRSPG